MVTDSIHYFSNSQDEFSRSFQPLNFIPSNYDILRIDRDSAFTRNGKTVEKFRKTICTSYRRNHDELRITRVGYDLLIELSNEIIIVKDLNNSQDINKNHMRDLPVISVLMLTN